jgi:hypothetical protein
MVDFLRQVALVSEVQDISFSDLTRTSAALQKQAIRDLGPMWDVQATVDAFHTLEDVPLGYWPIIIETDIGVDALGIHLDKDGQPFALVNLTEGWELTASHEALEMLVDPFGDRLVAGDSPKRDQGRVEFLVEVCDPSEAVEFGYTVNGITVSDFYTRAYFDPIRAAGVRYSFTGAITEPRQVLRGGYLSWHDPVSDHWWQEIFFGRRREFRDLGTLSQRTNRLQAREGGREIGGSGNILSLRAMIDRLTKADSLRGMVGNKEELRTAARAYPRLVSRPSQSKAQAWRAQIAALTGRAPAEEAGGGPAELARRPLRRGHPSTEETEEPQSSADRRQRSSQEEEEPEPSTFAQRRPPRKGMVAEE